MQKPLQARGVTPVTIHHSGHRQIFQIPQGCPAGRVASSLGQKADVALEFGADRDDDFAIVYGKVRIGGERQPDRTFRPVDTDEGRLDIVEVQSARAAEIQEVAERMVQPVLTAPVGYLIVKALRVVAGEAKDRQDEAMRIAEADDRVQAMSGSGPRTGSSDGRRCGGQRDFCDSWGADGGGVPPTPP